MTQFWNVLNDTNRILDDLTTPILERHGINSNELGLLLFLSSKAGDTASDFSRRRGVSKSQVSQAVSKLLDEKFITSVPDKDDRRILHLVVTYKAKKVIEEAKVLEGNFWSRFASSITPHEKDYLLSLREKFL